MTFGDLTEPEQQFHLREFFRRNSLGYSSLGEWAVFFRPLKITEIHKGRYLYEEGQTSGRAFLVLTGRLEVSKTTDTDQKKVLSFLKPGNWLGVPELFHSTRQVSVQALQNCRLVEFSLEDLRAAGSRFPTLLLELLKCVSRLVGDYQDSLVLKKAETKVLHYLSWLAQNHPQKELILRHTHEEIAEMLSLSRETVSKTLGQMQKAGILKNLSKDRYLLNPPETSPVMDEDSGLVGFYGSEFQE